MAINSTQHIAKYVTSHDLLAVFSSISELSVEYRKRVIGVDTVMTGEFIISDTPIKYSHFFKTPK